MLKAFARYCFSFYLCRSKLKKQTIMEANEITISENTAALLQSLKDMHEAYFNARAIVDDMMISDWTSEPFGKLNKEFVRTIGECVYGTFIDSDYTKI
jgi:hypothetical protein